jgi:hypothetical protein
VLTFKQIAAVRKFEQQYGESERCFSPDKHGEVLAADTTVVNATRAEIRDVIKVNLVYRTLPSGDVVIAHADDTE